MPRATSSTSPARPNAPTVSATRKAIGIPETSATWMMSMPSRTASLGLVCVIAMQMPIKTTAKQP